MRGINNTQSFMFTYLLPEQRIPDSHPLRDIKTYADQVLTGLSAEFEEMYSKMGRPSVPSGASVEGPIADSSVFRSFRPVVL